MKSNFLFILFTGLFGITTISLINAQTTYYGTLSSEVGEGSTHIGYGTGHSTSAGGYNTFIGHDAGNIATGTWNTFIGHRSGALNQTGLSNTFVGNLSGEKNTSGKSNTFVGANSGVNNSIGEKNSFFGTYSGWSNTVGNENTFLGFYSGLSNTVGIYNTFSGGFSGQFNTTGTRNVFMGYCSGLFNTVGESNVYVGAWAGYKNQTGKNNTFIGKTAGYTNMGDSSVFIGNGAGYNELGSKKLYIDNSNTSTPLVYGDFAKDSLVINGEFTINNNTASEGRFLICGPNGEAIWTPINPPTELSSVGIDARDNTYVGEEAGTSLANTTFGSRNTLFGKSTGKMTEGDDNVFLGFEAGKNNQLGKRNVAIGSGAGKLSTIGSGNVFIGHNSGGQEGISNKLYIDNSDTSTPLIYGDFAKDSLVINGKIKVENKLAIGTDATFPTTLNNETIDISAYTLFAKGGILTQEIRVQTDWADYVFEKDYDLKSLEEIEVYIAANGHLPNVPSATQVKAEGIELGDISRIQQEKIEELFLFTIQQQKEIKELKSLVNALLENSK